MATSTVPPICFISYSWDSVEHRTWVRLLAERLVSNGIDVRLDQWHAHPGDNLSIFMESQIREAQFVLLICTPNFAHKANLGLGGVGYEKNILTGELFLGEVHPGKSVPLLRTGRPDEALPSYLKNPFYLDFREETSFAPSYDRFLRHLLQTPEFVPRPGEQAPPCRLLALREDRRLPKGQ